MMKLGQEFLRDVDGLFLSTFLVTVRHADSPDSCGTEFWYSHQGRVAWVTAAHVFDGATSIEIAFVATGAPGNSDTRAFVQTCSAAHWSFAGDSDLAIHTFADFDCRAELDSQRHLTRLIESSDGATADDLASWDAFERLTIVGYPDGLGEPATGLPFATSGWNSSPLGVRHAGTDWFAIDCTHLPGSSGSPVFIFDPARPFTKKCMDQTCEKLHFGGTERYVRFLGVLLQGLVNSRRKRVTDGETNSSTETPPIGIGFVLRAGALDEAIAASKPVSTENLPMTRIPQTAVHKRVLRTML